MYLLIFIIVKYLLSCVVASLVKPLKRFILGTAKYLSNSLIFETIVINQL